jgi:hypothetical protein
MNTKILLRAGMVGAMAAFFTGCVGYNSALFATKTNVGLDFDTKTPTAEISAARREVVVAPSFENGQMPPVAASFRKKQGLGKWIFADIDSTFTGGDAAFIMTKFYNQETASTPNVDEWSTNLNSVLRLQTEPKRTRSGGKVRLNSEGTVHPMVFGTDTSLGLKVAWSGLTAMYPDSLKLGFNRKELAYAPVFGRQTHTTNGNKMVVNGYEVKMPSFLATMDSDVEVAGPTSTNKFSLQQYFATGRAADHLALRPEVREAMAKRLDPAALGRQDLKKEIIEGKTLSDSAAVKIDALPDAAKFNAAVDAAKREIELLDSKVAEIKTKADNDLPQAKKDLKKFVDEYAGGSKSNNDRLQRFLGALGQL